MLQFFLRILTTFAACAVLTACQEKDYNKVNLELDNLCIDVNNSYKCAQKIEKHQLKQFPSSKVFRDGRTLILKLGNTRKVSLTDPATEIPDGKWYSFRHYYQALGYFLIEIQYYEGGAYLLINDTTGDKYLIDDIPIISPSGRKFVTASGDLGAQYDPNRIQIYQFASEGITLEWSIEPTDWEPYGAEWLDDETIELYDSLNESPEAITLKHDGGTWQLDK